MEIFYKNSWLAFPIILKIKLIIGCFIEMLNKYLVSIFVMLACFNIIIIYCLAHYYTWHHFEF